LSDQIFHFQNSWCAFRASKPINKTTLLCLHGLGDSKRAFDELFSSHKPNAGLLVPDMPGYGASADAAEEGIDFETYIELLLALLDSRCEGKLIIVAHSMGGAIGVLLARSALERQYRGDPPWQLSGLINVEGNLIVADQFFSCKAVAKSVDGVYEYWFAKFRQQIASRCQNSDDKSIERYHLALQEARPAAFLANSRELVTRSGEVPKNELNEIARTYLELPIAKIYCLGEKSHPPQTLEFLKIHDQLWRMFPGAGHSLMIDSPDEFNNLIEDFIEVARS
jgi:pimeloyl-ACP methyl ester carboxylesterase